MLQRPSIKLPNRRLSQLTKTPTKATRTNHNENDNTTNQRVFHCSQSPNIQIEPVDETQQLLSPALRKNNHHNIIRKKNHILNMSTTNNIHPSPREELSDSSFNIHDNSTFNLNDNDNDNDNDDDETTNNNTPTPFVVSNIKNTETIQCMVRIRPLLVQVETRGRICVDLNESNNMITIDCKPKEKSFTFDHVGAMHSTQESIFQTVGKPITNACLSGYNGTIFAYGQTGSGKTFTILGELGDKNSSRRGLMPRVFDYLFSQIHRHRQKMGMDRVEYLVKCSCLEIYNERIQDLLEPDRCNLQVREDIKRGVVVEGLSFKICETANDALDLINVAGRNRRVSETTMNKESSRSHLMFTLLIECRISDNNNDSNTVNTQQIITKTPIFTRTARAKRNANKKLVRTRTSRFNLVDLAGSERQSKTNAKGDRLREAGSINKSLTVLGHVMKALVQRNVDEKNNKHRHIHYRDSKLTHLLKDSLGGNSLTFMIACISPSGMNLLESLSTLQFASRAKYIKNKAQLNEDQSGSVQVLKSENLKLVNEVEKLKNMIRKQRTNSFVCLNNSMEVDSEESVQGIDSGKLADTLEILERENYTIRRQREKFKIEIEELGKVIDKKQQFVMSLKMQLKLRENESIKLRNVITTEMVNFNGESLRNEIIERYQREEKERKMLLCDPSYLVEEHIKNMELQQQSQQMMDFIHRFIDDKDNKFRYDQYIKWKNTYQILVDENEELRLEMRENENESLKLLAVKEKMVEPKIEEYETRIITLNHEMEELKKNKDVLQDEIDLLHNKQNDLQNNYAELESKIQLEERKYLMEKQAMKDEYEKQLENMRQGAVRALDSNNEHTMQLKMQVTQLNAKMEATEKELIDTQSQYRQQTKELQNVGMNLNENKKSYDILLTTNNEQMVEISQLKETLNQIPKLEQNIHQLKDEQNANQSLLKEAQNINQELESKIGEKHSNINRLEAELETISQQFADLKLQYESLQDDHQILNDVQSTLEYQKCEMDDKFEQSLKELCAVKERNIALNSAIEDKHDIICKLKNEASEKMLNADEIVASVNKKNEDLSKTIDEMNAEIDGMKESLKESQNEMLRKDIDIEALRNEMDNITGQLQDYKSAHHELESKYSGYLHKYKTLEGHLSQTQHKCDSYNTALIEKNIKLQRLLEDNQLLKNEADKFQTETAKSIQLLNEEIIELQNEINTKKQQYESAVQEWQVTKSDMITCYTQEIETKNKQIATLKSEISALTESKCIQVQQLKDKLVEHQRKSVATLKDIELQHRHKCNELNNTLQNMDGKRNKIEKEFGIMSCKYENEKCKLTEKEQTLKILQKQLSQFKTNGNEEIESKEIESQMSQVFAQFNNQQIKLNEEIRELNRENVSLKLEINNKNLDNNNLNNKLIKMKKENELAKEAFELREKNVCEKLERADEEIQLRQNRSERLIKTFEQRLELRQKQNIDYRDKIDELSNNITGKADIIKKQESEIISIKDQLKRCQHTVINAQSLNETLLTEKATFDDKLEERDVEIQQITSKHNKLLSDLLVCNQQRENAIKTSKRMRLAEEKAYNDMFEWKTKYNNLQETSQRISNDMCELKKVNENLTHENSKLAGHHNAQQRINHLLNLKKECEKLKRDKKQLLNKISSLQKKLPMGDINLSAISAISSVSDQSNIQEQLCQMSASKDEMSLIVAKILNNIRDVSCKLSINTISNENNVDQHLIVLNTISNMINEQNNINIKLRKDIDGLQNDINIRDEQIKLLQDKIILTPTARLQGGKKSMSRLSSLSASHHMQKRKRRATLASTASNSTTAKKKRHSTDNFNF